MSSGSAAKEFEAFARDCLQLAAKPTPRSFVIASRVPANRFIVRSCYGTGGRRVEYFRRR